MGVRATQRQGERLLFTTDTFTPVLRGGANAPLTLQRWRWAAGGRANAGGSSRWQVDLAALL